MKVLQALCSGPAWFEGRGKNHEGEGFIGRLEIETLMGGAGLLLRYTARSESGESLHEEASLLAPNESGALCLWPVIKELPVVMPHPEVGRNETESSCVVVFASSPRGNTESFREELTIGLTGDSKLVYSHASGMPGGAFEARSSCTLLPAAA